MSVDDSTKANQRQGHSQSDTPSVCAIATKKRSIADVSSLLDVEACESSAHNLTKPQDIEEDREEEDGEEIPSPPLIAWTKQHLGFAGFPLLALLIIAYSIWAFTVDFDRAIPLLITECVVGGYLLVSFITRTCCQTQLDTLEASIIRTFQSLEARRAPALLAIIFMVLVAAVLVEDARNLVSGLGLIVFILISYLTSWKPRSVKWRPVLGGILLQFIFALLILKSKVGFAVFDWCGQQITTLLGYTSAGSSFVYGYLVDTSLLATPLAIAGSEETYTLAPPFFFNILSSIFFFSALISVCHYLGIVAFLMKKVGYVLALVLGTSASETLVAAANIFLGQSDAPLMVKAFINDMTHSELHAIMTSGFATVAGTVLAAYASFGISATHLLSASVMSAPAALAMSKLVYPETHTSVTKSGTKFVVTPSTDRNIIEAASNGAALATNLVLSIGAQLIAFLALVALLDGILGGIGSLVDIPELSFALICSYLFFPFAWLMGVEGTGDCLAVASLLGTKIFLNEFVAYTKLAEMVATGTLVGDKSIVIATYALCGFSNFGSIGVQLGSLRQLAPNKSSTLSKLVVSSMIAGNTACFMTACIAGLLYDSSIAES